MQNKRLVLVRLQKQQKSLEKQPIPNILVKRKGVLDFHFCIYGVDAPYTGGFYHGVLQLTQDYPFAPPKLKFFTPSGRFEVDKPICTSFTNFHKQSWSSAWNVRTMLLGTLSFMTGTEGGYGSMSSSSSTKAKYAADSLRFNLQNAQFVDLFKEEIIKLGLKKQLRQRNQQKQEAVQSSGSNALYIVLVLVLILWASKGYWMQEL